MKTNFSLRIVFGILLSVAAAVYAQTAPATSPSPSELLEKGIYNEETKGDLDSAITIYQQVVAEANANQSLAAQAQLRLGQCYLKKGRTTEATAAFEKLIHDFPNEKEFVAKAREYLPADFVLGPVPWVDGERMQLNIVLASGVGIGIGEYRADFVHQANGQSIWRVGCRMMAGPQSASSVDADPVTFRPVSSRWKHSLLGEATGSYQAGQVEIRWTGKTQSTTVQVDHTVYDNEEAVHLMRRLPLQVGYKTTMPIFVTLSGAQLAVGLEVVGKESVDVPAGKFECFKVHLGLVNQDFWLSDDTHRYLVKFEAGPVSAELTSVAQRGPGQAVLFHDAELGLSFTCPASWVVWRAHTGQTDGQVLIRTLDPDADTDDGGMRLFATDSLSETARQSARAWAEELLAKGRKVKVLPDSWKDCSIDGRPGVSYVAEYTESGKVHRQFLVQVLGRKNSELFVITSAPEKFEALKAQFDTILSSYRTK